MHVIPKFRAVATALLLLCAMSAASAQSAQSAPSVPSVPSVPPTPAPTVTVYGVLSLIGDRFDIVAEQPPVDALLDGDKRVSMAIDTPVFDNIAVAAVVEAVKKFQPSAEISVINSRSPVLFERYRELFAETGNTIKIPDAIMQVLKEQQATHFVLITKHRDLGRLRFANMAAGAGALEGLGFYLDNSSLTRNNVTQELVQGYIAPYVYMRVTLVELKSMQVVRKQTVTASSVFSPEGAKGGGLVWNALTSAEKVRALDVLIRREISRVVPTWFSE